MPITLDEAEIVSLFVESSLYGVFCVAFVITVYILFFRRETGRVNYPLLAASIIMWILSTIHVSIDLWRMLDAFYFYRDLPGGPLRYFSDVSKLTHVFKSAVYISHTCVGDSLVVYRAHAVCRNYAITLLLCLMVLGSAVSGYGSIYVLAHMQPGSIFSSALAPWITSFNVITAATNIIATALIAFRIWQIQKPVSILSRRHSLNPVISIIVESGAIYAASLILLTALYTTDNDAQFIVLDAVTPIIGIVFSLVIIRVALRLSYSTPASSTWKWTNNVEVPRAVSDDGYALRPIAVNVSTTTEGPIRETRVHFYDDAKAVVDDRHMCEP